MVGQQFDAASATLTTAGFSVTRLDDELSSQTPGTVISQDPTGGRLADQGSTITLTVAGAESTVPPVVGQAFDAASASLQRLSLVVVRNNVDSDKAVGTVLASNPPAGTKVPKGSTVTLAVAAEPGVNVPDVTGKSQQDAVNVMTFVGLQPTVVSQPSDTIPQGSTIGTEPSAGTRVAKGSPVRVLVSSGPAEVDVPIVIGATTQNAANALLASGFNVVVQLANGQPPGIVFDQNPKGGKLVKGGTVTIFAGQ